MKVLIISKYGTDVSKNKLDNLNNISSVYGYFFYHNFIRFCKDKNIELEIDIFGFEIDFNKLHEYDLCFYLYNRGIKILKDHEPQKYNILRKKIKKYIFTIAPTSKIQGDEDFLLHFGGKQKDRCLKINMVSDEIMLERKQEKDKIRILVDHKYYGNKNSNIYKKDKTEVIVKSLLQYKEKTDKNIEIIQINTEVPEGYSIINKLEDIHNYNRLKATSFKNIYEIYSKSDIFCVTHEEALGLSCVECNQAGCRVVSPDGYIKYIYGEHLDINYIKDDEYNWDKIINSLNAFRTHRKVRMLTYYKAIRLIFKKLKL